MDNPEEILHSLEEFSKIKPKDIPRELDDYLSYVAKTGDPVFKWSITKCLFREKLLKVITDFYESTLTMDLPPCPNVDPFNYDRMKTSLIEKLDSFHGAPFTVQRISELLTNPRKEYNRADKFMRAVEKNILVVSTIEPGKFSDADAEALQDASFNGIPEPNESGMDPSFPCNDLSVDPDSSSPCYEPVHAETQDIKVDNDTSHSLENSSKTDVEEPQIEESVVNDSSASDNVSSAEETIKEEQISSKEIEGVICSTANHDITHNREEDDDVPMNSTANESKEITESECSENDKSFETCIEEEPKEDEVNCREEEPSEQVLQVETSSASEDDHQVDTELMSENTNEGKENTVTDSLTVTDSVSSNNSDDRPVSAECDTSNSCDGDLEVKEEQEPVSQSEVLPTSDNEVTSCGVFMKEGRIIVNDLVVREASVIQATTPSEPEIDSETMEVDECQISSVEESDSSVNEGSAEPVEPSSLDAAENSVDSPKVDSNDTS